MIEHWIQTFNVIYFLQIISSTLGSLSCNEARHIEIISLCYKEIFREQIQGRKSSGSPPVLEARAHTKIHVAQNFQTTK